MESGQFKFKLMVLEITKDYDKQDNSYHGYIAVHFDYKNEMSEIGKFFALSQENKVLGVMKRLFGDKCTYSMEDWSILITPPKEEEFELAPYAVCELNRIEKEFYDIMEGN